MGKRKHKNKDPEEIRRKIRRLERRLDRHRNNSHSENSAYCDSDEYYQSEYSFTSNQGIHSVVSIPAVQNSRETVAPAAQNNINSDTPEIPVAPTVQNEDVTAIASSTQINKDSNSSTSEVLSADILEALGVSKHKVEAFAPKIRDEISERRGKIIVDGLSKESIQKLTDNILIPENFMLLKAPELNTEISTVITEPIKNRDKRLEKAQNHLGKGIAAITNLTSTLISGDIEKGQIIKKLSEAGQLLLDLHCQNTNTRRKLINYGLDKKFLVLIQGSRRDSLLFGENLGDRIKANLAAERSGLQIRKPIEPQPPTSSRFPQLPARQGNGRGPPRPYAQRGRGRGGPRTQASNQPFRRPPQTTDRYNASTKVNNSKTVHKN